MSKVNVLVFPCGSEVALEIHRSMKYSRHFHLIGGNSIDDHGKFVFDQYIGDIPFYNTPGFEEKMRKIVKENDIGLIYPAMDSVISTLSSLEGDLGCKVISSPVETTMICLSKTKTYQVLEGIVRVPRRYGGSSEIDRYPVFVKPDIGYGSRGARKINSGEELTAHLAAHDNCIILEYLPGKEYTIDCFTDRKGVLQFAGSRERKRVVNGISVNTRTGSSRETELLEIAGKINQSIKFRGAWFFQMKETPDGSLCLLEVASRLGGSSAAYRCKGVNFALMSAFDRLDIDVQTHVNDFDVELDRALDNRYRMSIGFRTVYIDLDDTILINETVNAEIVRFIFECINHQIKVILLTKHEKDLEATLSKHRLSGLFDRVIHIGKEDEKFKFISGADAIFIDDSYIERKKIFENCRVPVFAPDAVESLLK